MASIAKMSEQLEQLEKRIEEQKINSEQYLGEALIDVLDIDYELLSTKKDSKEVAEMIKNHLNSNPFANEDNEEQNNDLDNKSNNEVNEQLADDNNEPYD